MLSGSGSKKQIVNYKKSAPPKFHFNVCTCNFMEDMVLLIRQTYQKSGELYA